MMQKHEFSPVSEDCRIAPPLYYYMASSNFQFLETPERVATTLVEQRLLIQSLFVSLSSFGAIILYWDKSSNMSNIFGISKKFHKFFCLNWKILSVHYGCRKNVSFMENLKYAVGLLLEIIIYRCRKAKALLYIF